MSNTSEYYECNNDFNRKHCYNLCNKSWDFIFKQENKRFFINTVYCKCNFSDEIICDYYSLNTGAVILSILLFCILMICVIFYDDCRLYKKQKQKSEESRNIVYSYYAPESQYYGPRAYNDIEDNQESYYI